MDNYKVRVNINWLKRKRGGLLKQLQKAKPFIDGSVVLIKRTCGNKEHCHCGKGILHESYYLTYKEKKKTRTIYIPVDMEDEVFEWAEEYKRIKRSIREICKIQKAIIRNYVKEKRLKKGRS